MAIDYRKAAAPSTTGGASAPRTVSPPKVALTKGSPTVSLAKQQSRLRVNLNWDARPAEPRKGLLGRLTTPAALDLDLGCLWELADGRKGAVQALGGAFGSLATAPFIQLDGDDRSGRTAGGENLTVDLARADQIRRVLVFASIYQGAAGFDQAGGVVTLSPGNGPDVEVRLDGAGGRSRMCAIALLESDGHAFTVQRTVQYIDGAQDALDRAFGWGMNWRAGRK